MPTDIVLEENQIIVQGPLHITDHRQRNDGDIYVYDAEDNQSIHLGGENALIQLGIEGVKGLVGHKRPLRRQRVASYWRVLRSGLRPAGY